MSEVKSESIKILINAIRKLQYPKITYNLRNRIEQDTHGISDDELWELTAINYNVSVEEIKQRFLRADEAWESIMKGQDE